MLTVDAVGKIERIRQKIRFVGNVLADNGDNSGLLFILDDIADQLAEVMQELEELPPATGTTVADLQKILSSRNGNELVKIDGYAITRFDNVPAEGDFPGYLDLVAVQS